MSKKGSLADPSRLIPIDKKDEDIVRVIIETPSGSRNKYSYDEDEKIFVLKKVLPAGMTFPYTFGFVPSTRAEDGDPMDAMVILEEPTFPGCHIHARPIGVFLMSDEEGVDAKLLCVPASDPRWDGVQELSDLPEHELREVAHFFGIYKDLEPGKYTLRIKVVDKKRHQTLTPSATFTVT